MSLQFDCKQTFAKLLKKRAFSQKLRSFASALSMSSTYTTEPTQENAPTAETPEAMIKEGSNLSVVDFVKLVAKAAAHRVEPVVLVPAPNMDTSIEELEAWRNPAVIWSEVLAEQGVAQPEKRKRRNTMSSSLLAMWIL